MLWKRWVQGVDAVGDWLELRLEGVLVQLVVGLRLLDLAGGTKLVAPARLAVHVALFVTFINFVSFFDDVLLGL